MAQTREDRLKKLIQQVEPDQPKSDFTDLVMKAIEAKEQEALVINTALQTLMERNAIEAPSFDFTANIMAKVERLDSKIVYEPIISSKTWYRIGMAATLVLAFIGFFGQSSQSTKTPLSFVDKINHVTSQIVVQINALPSLLLISLICVSALLLIDYFLRQKRIISSEA